MSENRVTFSGLEAFRAQLRALPETLADEASVIVQEHAQVAAAAVRAVYESHRVTGNLAAGLVVEVNTYGRFGTSVKVRSKAKHAWLFENGSQARHYITAKGATHHTGAMWSKSPPTHIFIPTVMRFRRAMYYALADMLRRTGATVEGL